MKTTNTKFLLIVMLSASAVAFSSCGERERLEQQVAELEQALQERDSAFNEIMNLMTEVENQIESIKERENLLTSGSVEGSDKENLTGDLAKINELIVTANSRVDELTSKLQNADIEIGSFKRRVNQMSQDLEERKNRIASLEDELNMKENRISELDTEVTSLSSRVENLSDTVSRQTLKLREQDQKLHEAYLAVDTEKKLKEEGLVSSEGGFLWLGKTLDLKASAAQEKFRTIDIRDTQKIYVNSEKIDLITEHPEGSYELVKEDDRIKYIEVTDPEKFWKASKYLVVSTKS